MKKDVLAALIKREFPVKKPSKETLNHPALIHLASGLDPYTQTPRAFMEAYKSLGIDIVNRVPEENAPPSLKPGEVRDLPNGYKESYLGLYNTVARYKYPFINVEEFWNKGEIDPDYNELITPVPHRLDKEELQRKSAVLGDIGLYYYMFYTTLFMWGVEYLGWEVFLEAAAMDPDGFDDKFLKPVLEKTRKYISILTDLDTPFVFCHDDLADSRGPVFRPSWYEKYIFPKYRVLWDDIKKKGKKIIFVADGNMGKLLSPLRESGVDGVMLENPATDFDLILEYFSDRIIIGGVETGILLRGTKSEIKKHVLEVSNKTKDIPGFAISTPGGIHGNIPLENLEAYFDARVDTGYTPENWRKL
ncbi:MAG: hypothetical protein DRP87_10020 [Spirochaetes bacterium]|nr:MAG: hypothetical protein DRP87_10020 [Spirochaetota bacterium]